ncbi:hypothetical protein QTP86_030420 [Hemibagrus guttatus]|nr:hypothetical protein QTP86_030420 [Hemibagrus guttatus]
MHSTTGNVFLKQYKIYCNYLCVCVCVYTTRGISSRHLQSSFRQRHPALHHTGLAHIHPPERYTPST